MVGIAFGIDAENQSIGDILVSQRLLLYDLQRVGTDKKGKTKLISRGDRPHGSPWLFNRFQSADLYRDEAEPRVRFGLILSGEKLVDNIDFRQQLRELEPEAIGGEMEGAGLYVACQDSGVDWLLVKSICDWADGHKDENREINQRLAANNAANFLLHVLQHSPLKREAIHRESLAPNESNAQSEKGIPKQSVRQRLKFLDAFNPDPVTIKKVIDGFKDGEMLFVDWPAASKTLVDALQTLRAQADDYDMPSSPFVGGDSDLMRSFLDYADAQKAILNKRSLIEARIPFLLEELSTEETLGWREEALAYFLTLANFDLHWSLAYALMHRALKPTARAKFLQDPWHQLMFDSGLNYDKAIVTVMGWPLPLYRQNVMKLANESMNRIFVIPKPYCQGAFSTKKIGVVQCIIPQYELYLALNDPTHYIRYNGKVSASKTVDENSEDVYPRDDA